LRFAGLTGLAVAAIVSQLAWTAPVAAKDGKFADVDLSPTKRGPVSELLDITQFCGDKPIKVAYSDGYGATAWRKITRREFEVEAAKCPNITEVAYTDGQGNPQKQISDILGLTAQGFDVIVVFPDAGEAILKAMRQATAAGVAVVPFAVGTSFPGERGKDYLLTVTESISDTGHNRAEWIADQLDGEGNVIVFGGTPGNPIVSAQMAGWKPVFDSYPGIKVLEGPIDTNWDSSQYQKIMAGLLSKYPKIDAIYADYGLGVMGALRAYVAAGHQIPIVTAEDANELGCFWREHRDANPDFKLATTSGRNWISRLALRKAVAAVQGIDDPEPSIVLLETKEDSTAADESLWPKCDPSLPPDALLSSTMLTQDELRALFGN
tara:strand:- start:18037 stop:19173 length:1137 start_codon:yes stop_codon:yes gene_type:complete